MPRIREYTSSVNAGGTLNTQASAADFGAAVGQGVSDVGQGMYALDQRQKQEAEKLKQEQDRTDIADANAKVSAFQLEMANHLRESQDTAAPGASGFSNGYLSTYDERSKGVLDSITNPRARQQAQAHIDSFKTQTGARAFDFERDQQSQFRVSKHVQAVADTAKLVNADPAMYEPLLEQRLAEIDQTGASTAAREQMKSNAKQAIAMDALDGRKARDAVGLLTQIAPDLVKGSRAPEAAPTATAGGKADFNSVVEFIFKKEGGYAIDNNGAEVNFGINQKANPDVKVKDLTKEQAKQIYADRYWKQIGGDNLDPAMATVAMNAAVNMGVGAAKDLLAMAGGNPEVFTDLVKTRYEKIAQSKPENAKYLAGWVARADEALAVSAGQAPVLRDTQGQAIPQIKLSKDLALQPPLEVAGIPEWKDLSLENRQKFMASLITDYNSKIAVNRSLLNESRGDMMANLLAGNKYDKKAELQAQYEPQFGPEIAQRMMREDANAEFTGLFTKGIRGKSPDEIAALLGPPPGANSTADDYKAYQMRQSAVAANADQLRKTPNEYVDRYSTVVQGAAREVAAAQAELQKRNTPDALDRVATATQKYITSSLAEQRRLGVPNPQILSEPQEKALVAKIESTLASGQDVAANIDMLYKQYGSYANDVAQQINGKVSGLVSVLGSGIDPQAGTMLVEAHRNKDELKKTLGDKTKDLDVTVNTAMREFAGTLSGLTGSAKVEDTYREQISTLAMARMSKLGESQSEAVKQAYAKLVGDQYHIVNGQYRVPKSADLNAVVAGANYTIQNLSAKDMGLLRSNNIGNPQDRMTQQIADVKRAGRWVTATQKGPDGRTEEGLVLKIPGANGWGEVPGPDGKPIFRTFGQLTLETVARGVTTGADAEGLRVKSQLANDQAQAALRARDMRTYDRLMADKRRYEREAQNADTRRGAQ